ncbi:MAG: ABC transporter permease [Pirellulaceae bacterium]
MSAESISALNEQPSEIHPSAAFVASTEIDEVEENDGVLPMRYYGPRKGWQLIDFAELWRFRELIWAFGFRDLKVRYRQTFVGLAWAVIQPLFTVIVFGVLISWLRGSASDGSVPYVVTSLCGMVPWQFFAAAVSQATLSVAQNNNLIKKVYFPRVILPLSAFVPAAVDFAVAFVMLAAVMLFFGIVPGWSILFLPILAFATLVIAAAFALWLSAVNGIYRDVQFAVPFALQLGMMISPVVYETNAVVPAKWQMLYYLNPLAGLLQCYRALLLGSPLPSLGSLMISILGVVVLLITGMAYFRRMERYFADVS